MDPEDLKKCITPRTKAVSVVNLWGNIANMDAIMAIAREHNLVVIKDCSHAHGGEYGGKKECRYPILHTHPLYNATISLARIARMALLMLYKAEI